MNTKNNNLYEAPAASVVEVKMESGLLQASTKKASTLNYQFGSLDEDDND
jgi:hypothetical protein